MVETLGGSTDSAELRSQPGDDTREVFDRLARLAARAVGAPAALVALNDADSLRLAGSHGLPGSQGEAGGAAPWLALATRVLSDGPLVIADSRNSLLPSNGAAPAERATGAFLGVPLTLADGRRAGVIATVDPRPRAWEQDDGEVVAEFGRMAEAELERQRALADGARERREKQGIIAAIFDAFYTLDRDWHIHDFNTPAASVLGLSPEQLHGAYLWDLCPPESRHALEPQFQRAFDEGVPVTFEHHSLLVGRWFNIHVYPLDGVIGVFFRDIQAEKDSAAATRESAENFSRIFQHTFEGMFVHDGARILEVNDTLLAMLGLSAEEVIGHGVLEFVEPEQRQSALERLHWPTSDVTEMRLLRRDGTVVPVEVLGTSVRLQGQARRLVSVRDIRKHKQTEARLAASEQRYRSLFENNPLPVYWIDPSGAVRSANYASQQMTGHSGLLLTGKQFASLLVPADRSGFAESLGEVLGGSPRLIEVTLRHLDGRAILVELTMLPIIVDGTVGGVFGIASDITEARRAERELRFQKALLESQREASPDSIMVVSPEREIVAHNQRFIDLWSIPNGLVDGKPFANTWPHLAIRLADPVSWFAESRRFYEDMFAAGQGTLPLADGRVVEYRTAPVTGPDDQYYGRVWYHRDITEQVRAEDALREAEERYRMLVEQIPAVTYIDDGEDPSTPLYISPQVERMLGYPLECWKTQPGFWRDNMHPDDRGRVVQAIEAARRSMTRFSQEYRMLTGDGRDVWVQEDAVPIRDESGGLRYWQGVMFDITERKQAEEELRRQAMTFASISDGVIIADHAGLITDWNPAAERILGYDRGDVVGRQLSTLGATSVSEEEMARIGAELRKSGRWNGELVSHRKDGATVIGEWVMLALLDDKGERVATISVLRDITERKELEEELHHQAFHDPLTNLPNRALLFERLTHALEMAERHDLVPAVLFLDLDNFKVVNDSLGHVTGDRLLIAAAARVRTCLRSGDTVARLGGDEFAVLLEEADSDAAIEVADRIIAAISAPFQLEDGKAEPACPANRHELTITTSVGIALAEHGERDGQDLLRRADVALYRAKRLGKAGYAVFDQDMNVEALSRLELEHDLRLAVESHALDLVYQPIVELSSGRISGVEVLVRWTHPTRGTITPAEFVPIAEESGLILTLGREVLRAGCLQVRRWQQEIPGLQELALSVNLSARQFRYPGLVADIDAILRDSELDPRALKLEITESLMMEDVNDALETIRQLKQSGIEIAVDDFGTGYSSLAYLKRFPVDILKIDRSFINGLETNPEDQALVTAVIATARALGLTTTAEGVETEDELAELVALGCDQAQGYLLAQPAPADETERTLLDGIRLPGSAAPPPEKAQ